MLLTSACEWTREVYILKWEQLGTFLKWYHSIIFFSKEEFATLAT